MNNLSLYIYSKDRPQQLDLLIRSIQKYCSCKEIHVLFTYSDKEYLRAYNKLFTKYNDINIHIETEFKFDVIYLLENLESEYILGLSDDCCFIKQLKFDSRIFNYNIQGVNLHLNTQYKSCYTSSKKQNIRIPKFIKKYDMYIWKWSAQDSTWGFPCGVEGNIFDRLDYIDNINRFKFTNPNDMESACTKVCDYQPNMACYKDTILLNMPINRVQDTFLNKYGQKYSYSPKELNDLYLRGKIINLDTIRQTGDDFYQELELDFINE